MNESFPKSERLRYKALVDTLFTKGKSIYEYPLRLVYRPLSEEELQDTFRIAVPDGIAPLQVLITIPKKRRRHAIDRVLMRRRVREAWRLQRRPLRQGIEENPRLRTVSVALIYMSNENIPTSEISNKISTLIKKLSDKLK